MAFAKKSETTAAQNTTVTNANFEKAKGFLNVSVKMADGKYVQIGGIALRESKALEAALLNANIDDLELVCDIHHVVEKTSSDYQFATKSA